MRMINLSAIVGSDPASDAAWFRHHERIRREARSK